MRAFCPILPLLFTDANSPHLLFGKGDVSRLGLFLVGALGALGALFALSESVAAPLLGQLADRHGGKPILLPPDLARIVAALHPLESTFERTEPGDIYSMYEATHHEAAALASVDAFYVCIHREGNLHFVFN